MSRLITPDSDDNYHEKMISYLRVGAKKVALLSKEYTEPPQDGPIADRIIPLDQSVVMQPKFVNSELLTPEIWKKLASDGYRITELREETDRAGNPHICLTIAVRGAGMPVTEKVTLLSINLDAFADKIGQYGYVVIGEIEARNTNGLDVMGVILCLNHTVPQNSFIIIFQAPEIVEGEAQIGVPYCSH